MLDILKSSCLLLFLLAFLAGCTEGQGTKPFRGSYWRRTNKYDQQDYENPYLGQSFDQEIPEESQQPVTTDYEDYGDGNNMMMPGIFYQGQRVTEPSPATTPTPISQSEAFTFKENEPNVDTSIGIINGKRIQLSTGKVVYAFLGIPFAKAPVGDLRFKRPVPAEPFQGPYDATNLPNTCVQEKEFDDQTVGNNTFSGIDSWNPNTNISEDCLYLNIWVPEDVLETKGNNQLATVLFWIYGGGFVSGTSTLDAYNGAQLAGHENVVVVSANYRLGPLGFLYFGHEDAPGNIGLWDQLAAIKWTHSHISSFGGDPAAITLFGESCGSVSVGYHMLSPQSRPYFKRGVMMSGVPTDTIYGFTPPHVIKRKSFKLAKLAGCNIQQPIEDIVACLRDKPAMELTKLMKTMWPENSFLEFGFIPTIDGKFIDDFPSEIINSGRAKRTELMIGNVANEGTWFTFFNDPKLFDPEQPTSLNRDKFSELMKDIFSDYFSDVEMQAILTQYTNWENPDDGYANQRLLAEAIGDFYFVCPSRKFADAWSNRGLMTYYYEFTQRSSTTPWGKWLGVMHGYDIDYFLGRPMNESKGFTQEEKHLSANIMKLLVNFAKKGIPSHNWEHYHTEVPVYLDFNATIVSDKSTPHKHGPRAAQCAFWNNFLPQLKKQCMKRRPHGPHHPPPPHPSRGPQSHSLDQDLDTCKCGNGQGGGGSGGVHGGRGFHMESPAEQDPQTQLPPYPARVLRVAPATPKYPHNRNENEQRPPRVGGVEFGYPAGHHHHRTQSHVHGRRRGHSRHHNQQQQQGTIPCFGSLCPEGEQQATIWTNDFEDEVPVRI